MSESKLMNDDRAKDNGRSDWDIDGMTEEIYRELNGTVARSTIERELYTLFAGYEDAPVKTFVPVLVRRRAKDLLRKQPNNGKGR